MGVRGGWFRVGKVTLFQWISLKNIQLLQILKYGPVSFLGKHAVLLFPRQRDSVCICCAELNTNRDGKFLDCEYGDLAASYQNLWEHKGAQGVLSMVWISICWFYWLEPVVKDVCSQNCWRCKQYFKLLQAARYCIWTDWKLKCWYQKLN